MRREVVYSGLPSVFGNMPFVSDGSIGAVNDESMKLSASAPPDKRFR
jgi:hypothetical protein